MDVTLKRVTKPRLTEEERQQRYEARLTYQREYQARVSRDHLKEIAKRYMDNNKEIALARARVYCKKYRDRKRAEKEAEKQLEQK
jgi:hypothetical protein